MVCEVLCVISYNWGGSEGLKSVSIYVNGKCFFVLHRSTSEGDFFFKIAMFLFTKKK